MHMVLIVKTFRQTDKSTTSLSEHHCYYLLSESIQMCIYIHIYVCVCIYIYIYIYKISDLSCFICKIIFLILLMSI